VDEHLQQFWREAQRRYNPDDEIDYSIMVDGGPEDLIIAGLKELSDAGAREFFQSAGVVEIFDQASIDFDDAGMLPMISLYHKEGRAKTKRAVDMIGQYVQDNGYTGFVVNTGEETLHISGVEFIGADDSWGYSWPPDLQESEDIWRGFSKEKNDMFFTELQSSPMDADLWAKVLRGCAEDRKRIQITILEEGSIGGFIVKDMITEGYPKGILNTDPVLHQSDRDFLLPGLLIGERGELFHLSGLGFEDGPAIEIRRISF